ncbi:MAG: hypothetical protein ACKN9E_08235 [Microcystaceae cyanobacterium]
MIIQGVTLAFLGFLGQLLGSPQNLPVGTSVAWEGAKIFAHTANSDRYYFPLHALEHCLMRHSICNGSDLINLIFY